MFKSTLRAATLGSITNTKKIESTTFFINDNIYCFWDDDVDSTNLEFIKRFDPKYFEFIANHYVNILSSEDTSKEEESHISISLRNAYSHALESFFALLFATIQSPNYLPAWLLNYNNWELRTLVKKLKSHDSIKSKIKLDEVSFEEVANQLLLFQLEDKKKEKEIKGKFVGFWKRIAKDFLNKDMRSEYNSIKHGFRLTEGGFSLKYAKENNDNELPKHPDFKTMGGSKYGASYFTYDKISDKKPHYQLNKFSSNWSLKRLYHKLILISLSIENLKTFWLLIYEQEANFKWPGDLSFFDYYLKSSTGITGFNMKRNLDIDEKTLPTKSELIERYKQTFS